MLYSVQWRLNVNMWMILRAVSYFHMLARYNGFVAVIPVNIPLRLKTKQQYGVYFIIIKQNYHKTTNEQVSKNHQKLIVETLN